MMNEEAYADFSLQSTIVSFTALAYQHADIDPADWIAGKGYRSNKAILYKLYYYYQQLYLRCPGKFLWAGLARLTGGQVLYGMNNIVRIAKDPCALTVNIVDVAKAIFENMAWQHELFLADPALLLKSCRELDKQHPAQYRYEDCWNNILQNDENTVAEGNKMLLKNEQHDTIQHHYEQIRKDAYAARYFWFTRFVMRNIHPHHRRFIVCFPFGDVTQFRYRWQWIEGKKGMWQTWIDCGSRERTRLVSLSNEAVINHQW